MRKGFVERIILHILNKEGALHSYGIIKAIRKLTFNTYSPSPGAIYPALKNLLKKNLINETVESNRKLYIITEKGKTAISLDASLAEHIEKICKSGFPLKELSNIAKLLNENWDKMDKEKHREIVNKLMEYYNELSEIVNKNEDHRS